ncbi:hypothetical protein TNCV_2782921 [Trichonephila clavipes]|nr:hypothetical protein TNCV_2782921 [Trichonephila clavipes]
MRNVMLVVQLHSAHLFLLDAVKARHWTRRRVQRPLCNTAVDCLPENSSPIKQKTHKQAEEPISVNAVVRVMLCSNLVQMSMLYGDFNQPYCCQVIYSQFGLAIHQYDHQARRRFIEWAQNEIAVVRDFHKQILFSDEAHFWLNGYVNKQNCRICSEANPQVYVETPLHPDTLNV